MVSALNQALFCEMELDENIVVLGEDVGIDGGVFRVTEGLWQRFGSERIIDTPLGESGIVGVAIGMAAYGLRPVVEIQFSGFSYPAFDQLISHASRLRNRSRGRFSCPLVVRTPYGGGVRALEHHSESMEALYAHVPGLKVVIPSGPYDAKGLLSSAIRDPDPVIFYEPKRVYRAIKEEVPEKAYTIPIGEAKVIQNGNDVTIISWGAMIRECKEAIDKIDASAELIDIRTLKPLDFKTILNSVKKTGRVVIVHEAPRTGGFGAEIASLIAEHGLLHLEAPIMRVTGFDTIFPLAKLEKSYLPDERITAGIKKVLEF